MKKELKDAFGALGRLWLTEINATKFEKKTNWPAENVSKILDKSVLEYQSTLQMVTSKSRNQITSENLEVLFLLGTLKIPVKNPEDCENERKRLEKKKWTLNYFLFSMRLYCKLVQKRKLKKKKLHDMVSIPPGKTYLPK